MTYRMYGYNPTIELSEILKNLLVESGGVITTDFQTTIKDSRPLIFNFNYGLSEVYKEEFETMFLARNYFKKLSQETYTRWHYKLQAKLIENVSKYNILFELKTKDIEDAINTFKTVSTSSSSGDMTGSNTSTQTSDGENNSYQKSQSMDTPQGRMEIEDKYVSGLGKSTNVAESITNASDESNSTQTQSSNSNSEVSGYSGSGLNSLMLQHAVVIQEVITMILNDFDDLFSSVLI